MITQCPYGVRTHRVLTNCDFCSLKNKDEVDSSNQASEKIVRDLQKSSFLETKISCFCVERESDCLEKLINVLSGVFKNKEEK